ncbi:hypothetical protein KM043_008612 [Ampulex compressa]|nr:hypothetical protein KM043_008612 [Ampulex compressa]
MEGEKQPDGTYGKNIAKKRCQPCRCKSAKSDDSETRFIDNENLVPELGRNQEKKGKGEVCRRTKFPLLAQTPKRRSNSKGSRSKPDKDGARVESEDEDVTPTAVAKEVIGLRPCARYLNRRQRRSAYAGVDAPPESRQGRLVRPRGGDVRHPPPFGRSAPLHRDDVSLHEDRLLRAHTPPSYLDLSWRAHKRLEENSGEWGEGVQKGRQFMQRHFRPEVGLLTMAACKTGEDRVLFPRQEENARRAAEANYYYS